MNYVFDIECYSSLFTITFIPTSVKLNPILDSYEKADMKKEETLKSSLLILSGAKQFVINPIRNDMTELIKFLMSEVNVLYGYNNKMYDDVLLKAILFKGGIVRKTNDETTETLRTISDKIIENQNVQYYLSDDDELKSIMNFNLPFFTVDLKTLNYLTNVSLKFVGVLLKHYRIQDLPVKNLKFTASDNISKIKHKTFEILDYNVNDVLITKKLLHFSKSELEVRIAVKELYGVEVTSDSRSTMSSKLIAHYYKKLTGFAPNYKKQTIRYHIDFNEIIFSTIKFETPELIEFKNSLTKKIFHIGIDSFKPSIIYNQVKYKLGLGGIHSDDRPVYIEVDDTYTLKDVDASEFTS